MPPTSSDTDSDDSEYVSAVARAVAADAESAAETEAITGSPHSTVHMGPPPPPPPPIQTPTTPEMRLEELTPPPRLRTRTYHR